MGSVKSQFQDMTEYVNANLADICTELLDWKESGILTDGKFRIATQMLTAVTSEARTPIVESTVHRCSMEFVRDFLGKIV